MRPSEIAENENRCWTLYKAATYSQRSDGYRLAHRAWQEAQDALRTFNEAIEKARRLTEIADNS